MHGKLSEEYPVNVGVPQSSILGPTLFLLYINDLADNVICNFNIYADDTTLCSRCDQASDLRQQLGFAIELESDIRLLISMLEKLSLFCLASLITLVLLM